MATDYDAPRSTVRDELMDNPGPLVGVVGNDARSGAVDEIDTAESVELPGADLSGEQLTVRVVPQPEAAAIGGAGVRYRRFSARWR